MLTAKTASLTTAALFVTALLSGAQGTRPPRLVLQALDTDGDGRLSAAEIEAAPQSLLKLDRNGDGQLTSDELQPRPQNAGASTDELVTQLMLFDRNGDGVLTPDELPARMQAMFLRGDTNHDGKLTPDEIRAMAARQGMPAGTRVEPGHADLNMRLDPLLNALDADHDGVISAAEIAGASRELLTLDTAGTGQLTAAQIEVRQQTPAERTDHLLEDWDTDRDGKISKAEAPDRLQAQFATIDRNGDGLLDRAELLLYFSTNQPAPNARPAGVQPREGKQ